MRPQSATTPTHADAPATPHSGPTTGAPHGGPGTPHTQQPGFGPGAPHTGGPTPHSPNGPGAPHSPNAHGPGGRPDAPGSRPDGTRPDASRPRPDAPGGHPGGSSRPDSPAPHNRPDGSRPDGSRPDGSRPDGTRPDASRPDGARPRGDSPTTHPGQRPDAPGQPHNRPDGTRPDGHGPDGTRHRDPDAPGQHHDKPDTDKPDSNTPDGPNSHADEPRPDPAEAHARHAETTPAGVSHHGGDPNMGDLPHRVPNDPRFFTADVHITPDGRARIGGHDYTPAEYADMLRRSGYDGSKPVRLIGCDAGSNDFAKQLSKHLDAPVVAPTKPAWTDANGRVFTSDADITPDGTRQPKIPPNGEWETHHPDGSRTKASDDGYAPGSDRDTDGADAQDRAARPGDRERPSHQDIDWQEPHYSRTEPRTVNSGEPFYDPPAHNPNLDPNTRYDVTDANGRQTTVYTDGSNPPRVTHVDAHTSNTRTGYPGNPVDNPDASYTQPDVDYRVHADGDPFTFHTDDTGRPVFDLDDFNAPHGPEYEAGGANYRTADWDSTGPPFSHRTDLEADRRYHVTNENGDWHGDFYTSPELTPDGRSQFTHIDTWTDQNPELGNRHTMREPDVRPTDGLPLEDTRYQVDDRVYHTNGEGNSAVSFEPDYSAGGHPGRDSTVQGRMGKVGEHDYPGTHYRGGHTQDHVAGGTNEAIGVTPQVWRENNILTTNTDPLSRHNDSWRRSEMDRQVAHNQGEPIERVRVFPTEASRGLTPDRQYWIEQRVDPATGKPVVHYRSHDNV